MTDITELAQREKFEAWFKSSFHPDKTGPYIKDQLYFAWKAAGAELVEALEKAQQRIAELDIKNCELNSLTQRWAVERAENADRIAELESRTVKLPKRHSMLLREDFNADYHTEMAYKADEVQASLAVAGIKVEAK
ncbi:hypothetical protein J9A75_06840 [Klebsiella pneumoniae]|nr:hypothetical protein [Klebsiella pneumoniae]HCC4287276.1 hypothetical protein [Klebsiella pneumoniae]HDE1580287.1 hypothetical protein [Klebsiella pneumoniae]